MNEIPTLLERRNHLVAARKRRVQGMILSLERCLATKPDLTKLLQRAAAARGAMNGLVSDLMEERLRSLQALTATDQSRTEVAEMIDIVPGYSI